MILDNYINNNNIEQYYVNNENLDEIRYFKNLNKYIDLTKNTIFICDNEIDIYFCNFHKGKKWVFLTKNFSDEKINNFNNIELFFTDSNKFNNKIININSKLFNLNEIKKINKNNMIFMILATQKPEYKERYDNLINYLKNFNYDYYILLAGNKTEKINNYLYVSCQDYYEELPKKVILGLEYIFRYTDYNYVYKVDDDFYNYNINLDESIFNYDYYGNYIIKNFNNKYHFGKCYDKDLNNTPYICNFINKYAAGGYGYLLSRKAIYILINNKNYIMDELYEDKAIGDVLYINNIYINDNPYNKLNYKKPIILKKCAVLFYHKNIQQIYKERWYKKCVETILNQTYKEFDIFEINYGGENFSIMDGFNNNHKYYFFNKILKTHTEAMVYLLNICFHKYNYDVVFNTNLDDYYYPHRFETQLKCINDGYYLCSSLMNYITEKNNEDIITLEWKPETFSMKSPINSKYIDMNEIKIQLNNNHNVLVHPCIAYTKEFWNSYDEFDNLLRYRNDKPFEDLTLWTRAINNKIPITIINEPLISYRIHDNQIGEQNKKDIKDKNVDSGFVLEPNKEEKRIGIFIIATGNYIYYFEKLLESIESKFLIRYKKIYIITTDNEEYMENICKKNNVRYKIDIIYKKGFPLDTLYRYKYLLHHGVEIELLCDVIYYLDVDMLICENIDEEILPNKQYPYIGTKHPGFAYCGNPNGAPETNILSTAYINPNDYKKCYIAGGFNGGLTHYFIQMAEYIDNNINIDKSKDIMAEWHDESHLNKFFIDNYNKFKILSSDYCYPENYYMSIPGTPKILALDKKHDNIRNIFKKNHIIVEIMGGLGNILFQIFFAYTIAIRYNLELCIKVNQKDEKRESIFHYHLFDNIMRIKFDKPDETYHKIIEKEKHYIDFMSNIPINKNIYMFGFFQSSLFFKDYFNIIKKHLNYEIKNIAEIIFNKIKKEFNNYKLIAIHIRGGDYKYISNYHNNLTIKYYIECITKIKDKNKIKILFTDDIEYSENNFSNFYDIYINDLINKYIPDEYKYLNNSSELHMFLISMFNIIICANSTFSLWASYFSNAEQIFIPKEWFGKDGPDDFNIDELKLNENYNIV
jgi:histo-blood group ABO system transferase